MQLLRNLFNLLLYGNFWIAACAAAMTLQTIYVAAGSLQATPYLGFVTFSTLILYAFHRIIGLKKVKPFTDRGRYFIIEKYKNHILVYAVLGTIGSVICFFLLSLKMQIALVLPALLSLGYVIPFLKNKQRLRDLDHLKIFLVALVWSWVTVALPLLETPTDTTRQQTALLLLERALFIFALTLPFDVRDLQIDGYTGVRTLPSRLGIPRTKKLASLLLLLTSFCAFLSVLFTFYSFYIGIGIMLSCYVADSLIRKADTRQDDYFFSFGIDGLMILQFVLVVGLDYFLG